MGRLSLYYHTLRHMRPAQTVSRVRKKLGLPCSLGVRPAASFSAVQNIASPAGLDFDPVFLARFSVEELMENRLSLLHATVAFDWNGTWNLADRTALWNYNLHYFEYLFPLLHAWRTEGDPRYLNKTVEMITGWIQSNPKGTQPAWAPFTTALRIVAWISYYAYAGEALPEETRTLFLSSLHEQYRHLAGRLEKDVLGNHYFEDLKSLVLASLFFQDEPVLEWALSLLKEECKEEILLDGMHFELSPMYHKIIFEGLLRVTAALRGAGRKDGELEKYLPAMLDAAFSLEEGLDRVPLFNDCGNNVAKSLAALMQTAETVFGLTPRFCNQLPTAGYYIFRRTAGERRLKLIVDAGQPGPAYIPGHAHCDAMSYELFCDGEPVAVNCGTFAYQCSERAFYRGTAAHNTVMVNGTEQSQCWSAFRLARRSSTRVLAVTDSSIRMEMTDQNGNRIERFLELSDEGLLVEDRAQELPLSSFVHLAQPQYWGAEVVSGRVDRSRVPYAVDYGAKKSVECLTLSETGKVAYFLRPSRPLPAADPVTLESRYSGYKPLAFLDGRLYFYVKGHVWTPGHTGMTERANLFGSSWKDRSRLLVRLLRREPRAATPIDGHRMIVAAGRRLYLVDLDLRETRVIFTAREGFSCPLNVLEPNGSWLAVWGDYGANPNREAVSVYGLTPELTVETVFTFAPGQVRHIHNIIAGQNGGCFIFTGDQEPDAGIYRADGDFKQVKKIRTGRQQYRAVIGFDTPQGLLYATDAVNEQNYVYLLPDGGEPEAVCPLNGSCIYGTAHNGACYFASTVEPDETNRGALSWLSRKRGAGILSNESVLVRVDGDLRPHEVLRFSKDFWPMKLFQYGSIQFPGGEGDALWCYPVAVKGDGTAMRIDE